MPNALRGASLYQWAAESTKGTDLACTSKMLVEEMDLEPEDALYRPSFINGVLAKNTGNESPITRGTRWRASGPLTYEQAIQWFEGSHQGAITPTGTNPYTWTYTRNATAVPSPDSFTFERRISDTSNNIDAAWHHCMVSSLELTGSPRGVVMFKAEGFGRRIQTETATAALSLPTTEQIPHGTVALYIDSTFANLGTTVVSNQLLEWRVKFITGFEPIFTSDGRSDLDMPTYIVNTETVDVEFEATCLVPGSGSQFSTEKTAAEASPPTLRAVELRATSPGGVKSLKVQFLAKHEKASVFQMGTMNGQITTRFRMVGSTDATNLWKTILINSTATDA